MQGTSLQQEVLTLLQKLIVHFQIYNKLNDYFGNTFKEFLPEQPSVILGITLN